MTRYRFVGWQDPGQHRPGRITDGAKTLELNGDAVALSDAQYERISPYARLEPVDLDENEVPAEEQQKATAGRPISAVKSDSKES